MFVEYCGQFFQQCHIFAKNNLFGIVSQNFMAVEGFQHIKREASRVLERLTPPSEILLEIQKYQSANKKKKSKPPLRFA